MKRGRMGIGGSGNWEWGNGNHRVLCKDLCRAGISKEIMVK